MKSLSLITLLIISLNSYGQEFKQDPRPDSVKEDYMNEYQASQISKVDLLRALNSLGVRIFNIQIAPKFQKVYKLEVSVNEFVNGKKVSSKSISPVTKNIYNFWQENEEYADYVSRIKFFTRDIDSAASLTIDIAGNTTGGIKLKQHTERKHQFYLWRSYSVTDWKLNVEIPLIVYSSSWYDKANNFERSCGAVDLSRDKAATQELFNNSQHYFVISYKISD